MSNICPKGHFSTDTDYCSECGAPIKLTAANNNLRAAPVAVPDTVEMKAGTVSANIDCPDCMTPRRSGARYCEVCRYDFELATSFNGLQSLTTSAPLPATSPASATAPQIAGDASVIPEAAVIAPQVVIQASFSVDEDKVAAPIVDAVHPVVDTAVQLQRLKLVIMVDPTLYTEEDPANPCPVGAPDREYHLDLDEQTLGRQFEGKGIYPEIVVQDPGISRRHLKLMRDERGNHTVLDVGSANGTALNNHPLEVGIVSTIRPGDQLTLGMWTRIRVELR